MLVNQLPIASLLYNVAPPELLKPGVTKLMLPKEENSTEEGNLKFNKEFSPTLNKARTLFYLNTYKMPILEEEEHRFEENTESKTDKPKSPVL